MTKVEFIESKREGMIRLYQKLDEFYKLKNSFESLKLEDIEEMIRDIDESNFEAYKKDFGYVCCGECEHYKA